jgi:hypothetical protein
MPEHKLPASEKWSGKIQATFVTIHLRVGYGRHLWLGITLAPNLMGRLPRLWGLRARRAGLNFLFSY